MTNINEVFFFFQENLQVIGNLNSPSREMGNNGHEKWVNASTFTVQVIA